MKEVTSELLQRMRSLPGKEGWGLLGKGTTGVKTLRMSLVQILSLREEDIGLGH